MTTPSGPAKVAFWDLDNENEGRPVSVPPSFDPCISTSGVVDIGIFDEQPDIRVPAIEADTKPGGKYYSILKLFFWFEGSKTWTTATGWLLDNRIVVTAAHCIYHDNQRANRVLACIGYNANSDNGDDSVSKLQVARRVAIPLEWISTQAEQIDVAFLQLGNPFENATPITRSTPEINARQQFRVVGYPADLQTQRKPGGEIYEMKISRDINLERTKQNMLLYQGDLQGGFSGAPAIRDSDFAVIGVHVRGGTFNSAVVVNGPYGVNFDIYERAVGLLDGGSADSTLQIETDPDQNWLKYINVPLDSSI